MQFLQNAHVPVKPTTGVWNLWEDAIKNQPLARDVNKVNVAKDVAEKKEPAEAEELQIEVDESQFKENDSAEIEQ